MSSGLEKEHDEVRAAFDVLSGSYYTELFKPLNWFFAGHNLAREQDAGKLPSNFVPGAMHCVKCNFTLQKVVLCVANGQTYAAKHTPEPCPNGCGPLAATTWEQEARAGWKHSEALFDRLKAAEDELAALKGKP